MSSIDWFPFPAQNRWEGHVGLAHLFTIREGSGSIVQRVQADGVTPAGPPIHAAPWQLVHELPTFRRPGTGVGPVTLDADSVEDAKQAAEQVLEEFLDKLRIPRPTAGPGSNKPLGTTPNPSRRRTT